MIQRGLALLLGDDINTDELHPSHAFSLDPTKRAPAALAAVDDADRDFEKPRIIVAGWNFGIGSSRESTIRGLMEAGIVAIVARSMARIFLRNAINAGLAIGLRTKGFDEIASKSALRLNSSVPCLWQEEENALPIALDPLDSHLLAILEAGGLLPYLEIRQRKKGSL